MVFEVYTLDVKNPGYKEPDPEKLIIIVRVVMLIH